MDCIVSRPTGNRTFGGEGGPARSAQRSTNGVEINAAEMHFQSDVRREIHEPCRPIHVPLACTPPDYFGLCSIRYFLGRNHIGHTRLPSLDSLLSLQAGADIATTLKSFIFTLPSFFCTPLDYRLLVAHIGCFSNSRHFCGIHCFPPSKYSVPSCIQEQNFSDATNPPSVFQPAFCCTLGDVCRQDTFLRLRSPKLHMVFGWDVAGRLLMRTVSTPKPHLLLALQMV